MELAFGKGMRPKKDVMRCYTLIIKPCMEEQMPEIIQPSLFKETILSVNNGFNLNAVQKIEN